MPLTTSIILSFLTFVLIASSAVVSSMPVTSPTTPEQDDDPLVTSETGHFRRKGFWRKILRQLSGQGGWGGVALDLFNHGGRGLAYNNYYPVGGHIGHYGGGFTGGHFPIQSSLYGGGYGVQTFGALTHGGGVPSWEFLDGYGWGGFDNPHYDGGFF